MARLEDMVPGLRATIENLECPAFEIEPWVQEKPVKDMRVALISSAALRTRDQENFAGNEAGYRTIPASTAHTDILMSHLSVNFDRTGFQQDMNCVLPVDRLEELEADGTIGSAAPEHYSFLGSTDPVQMETHARALAKELHTKQVDAVILLPV